MFSKSDTKKLIYNHSRRLQKLREQQAIFGLDTPPAILIEIEDTEGKIEELQKLLQQLSPRVSTFHAVPLPDTHSFSLPWGNENPPLNEPFHGIQFKFRTGTNNRPVGLRVSYGDEVTIPVDMPNADSIFVLLNAEYAFKDLGKGVTGRHRQVGEIILTFSNRQKITEPLILGVNIRDWFVKNPVAITEWETEQKAVQVWRGSGKRELIIDMLNIEWDQPAHLKSIIIRNHLQSEIVPDYKPGILVWAITGKVV